MRESQKTSKTLSYWLRHSPETAGLQLDSAGWADTEAVLAALGNAGVPCALIDLERVVSESDKNRFELSSSRDRIRARQGHSIAVDADWRIAIPPALLFHGTVDRFLDSILTEGLVPKSRHHVHLSPDIESARQVGAQRGRPVILEVMAGELAEAGVTFYLSGNGVWLTQHVPAAALRRLD
jgi:putative RNA 2'-phosphotransferase